MGAAVAGLGLEVKDGAGSQDEEAERVLQLDGCSASQRSFKTLSFPQWCVEGRGSAA